METGSELEKYPFEVAVDEDLDWLDVTIDVELAKPATVEEKKELEETLAAPIKE